MRRSLPLDFEPREVCPRCERPTRVCYCAHLTSIDTKTRIVLLQHPREEDMAIGTARMASLCLPNSELHVGVDFQTSPALRRALSDPSRPAALLYPSDGAVDVLTDPPRGPITLVVVDGTWWQARKLVRVNPEIAKLPRYAFRAPTPSEYRIRSEPDEAYVSTIEALVHVLGVLEGDPEKLRALLVPFRAMIDTQIALREHGARRARPSQQGPCAAQAAAHSGRARGASRQHRVRDRRGERVAVPHQGAAHGVPRGARALDRASTRDRRDARRDRSAAQSARAEHAAARRPRRRGLDGRRVARRALREAGAPSCATTTSCARGVTTRSGSSDRRRGPTKVPRSRRAPRSCRRRGSTCVRSRGCSCAGASARWMRCSTSSRSIRATIGTARTRARRDPRRAARRHRGAPRRQARCRCAKRSECRERARTNAALSEEEREPKRADAHPAEPRLRRAARRARSDHDAAAGARDAPRPGPSRWRGPCRSRLRRRRRLARRRRRRAARRSRDLPGSSRSPRR